MTPALKALLEKLPADQQLDFSQLLQALHAVKYTGAVTFDFAGGLPRQISLGAPIRLTIVQADQQEGLDNRPRSRSG